MAKKPQSEISKAIDKSNKLSGKGKYDDAIKVLMPYQTDQNVRKMIEALKGLKVTVKELKAHPLHKKIRWGVSVKANQVTPQAKEKRGCWPFRF